MLMRVRERQVITVAVEDAADSHSGRLLTSTDPTIAANEPSSSPRAHSVSQGELKPIDHRTDTGLAHAIGMERSCLR